MAGDVVMRIGTVRQRTSTHTARHPVPAGQGAHAPSVLHPLSVMLASELVCVWRYLRADYVAEGTQGEIIRG